MEQIKQTDECFPLDSSYSASRGTLKIEEDASELGQQTNCLLRQLLSKKVNYDQNEHRITGGLSLSAKDDSPAAPSKAEISQNHQHSALYFWTNSSKADVKLSKNKHGERDLIAQSSPVPLYCVANRGLNSISDQTSRQQSPIRFPERLDILSESFIKEEAADDADPSSCEATVVMKSAADCHHISGNSNGEQNKAVELICGNGNSSNGVSFGEALSARSDMEGNCRPNNRHTENRDEKGLYGKSDEDSKDTPKVVQETSEEDSNDEMVDEEDSPKNLIDWPEIRKCNTRKLSLEERTPGNENKYYDDVRNQSELEIESRRKNLYAKRTQKPLDSDVFHVKQRSSSACWICLKKYVCCLTVKNHIIQRHSKALGAIYQEETKGPMEKCHQPQLLVFCPNDCNYITAKPDALLRHMSSCQKAKLQTGLEDFMKIQTDFISNDFEKLQHRVASGTIGRGKERSFDPTAGMKRMEQNPLLLHCIGQNDNDKDIITNQSQDKGKSEDVVPASVKRSISPTKGERDDNVHVVFGDDDEKDMETFHEVARRDRTVQLTDEEYNRLLKLMSLPVSERAKTRQDDLLFRKAKKHNLKLMMLPDPYRGEEVCRITKLGRIILPPHEVGKCIEFYHRQAFGDSRDKLVHAIRQKYVGISRDRIVQHLNKPEVQSQSKPYVKNKAYCPIAASQLMERHQIDVIDLGIVTRIPGKYSYVLSVLDCFSHFLWMRIIPDKKASTISEKLKQIYCEYGTPRILQSSQGREFHKELEGICRQWNVKLTHSRSDQAQPQNRIERFQGAWQTRIRSLVCRLLTHPSVDGKDLAEALPEVTRNYNITHHSGIGMSPYECIFGMPPNFISQAYAGGLCEDLPEDEQEAANCPSSSLENEGCEDSEMDCDEISESLKKRKRAILVMRNEATKISLKRQRKIEDYHHQKFYSLGEVVTVKGEGHYEGVKGDMSSVKTRFYKALVRDRKDSTYTVMIVSNDRRGEIETVNVDKIIARAYKKRIKRKDDGMALRGKRETTETILKRLENLENDCQKMSETSNTGMEILLENAACHRLELDKDNSVDGNYLFCALQVQLEKHGIDKTEVEIRREVVAFLSQNVLLGVGKDCVYLPDFLTGYPSWEAFLEDLGQGALKGHNLVLLALVNLYNISVWIVSSVTKSEPVILQPSGGISKFDLRFGRISETHYVSLWPRPELCEHCGVVAVDHKCKDTTLSESEEGEDFHYNSQAISSHQRDDVRR